MFPRITLFEEQSRRKVMRPWRKEKNKTQQGRGNPSTFGLGKACVWGAELNAGCGVEAGAEVG